MKINRNRTTARVPVQPHRHRNRIATVVARRAAHPLLTPADDTNVSILWDPIVISKTNVSKLEFQGLGGILIKGA